jgi:hypothetical protein
LPCRIAPGYAHDTPARMRTGSAKEQTFQGRSVLGRARDGPHHQELVQRQFRVVPMTAGYPELTLEILRSQQLGGDDARKPGA